MVHYATGDLLKSDCKFICHQVNCQKKMGSGIAKQIREKWQAVYDVYMMVSEPNQLGHIQQVYIQDPIVGMRSVINMFAQENFGYDGRRYTSYDAFWSCLGEIKDQIPKGNKIGFPDHIGCGLGGANWEIIRTMIEQVLGDEYEVYIYMLEEEMHG